ncbi:MULTISPECIES: hypothetical protein [unclassified Variovorax]|uniref:hypothetical protein n=1 Tax=unclassified Variovorax TaxID=663243 RepID=UPI000F7EC4B6|nr:MULTISPECIES: hypothetical protein [unclassified Variovorax]RSZ37248.1 hypothetical protein EJO70_22805 [Variovorax sp. 553]RSZ38062.1 hypothetical protein EJO71_22800 [Variovorax sp. 679]
MPIIVNPPFGQPGHQAAAHGRATPRFIVDDRDPFAPFTRMAVDRGTSALQLVTRGFAAVGRDPLGPVERGYDASRPHQGAGGQGTMRAHHVADSRIQQMVCDYMNEYISLPMLMDRIGSLYLTSWIDVLLTPRIFTIYAQWGRALIAAFIVLTSQARAQLPAAQAVHGTRLATLLSNSVSNLRVGHGATDNKLGRALAPRLQRGQFDLIAYFIGWLNGHNFAQPTLSVETSIVSSVWGENFTTYPLVRTGGGRRGPPTTTIVGNVFLGPTALGNHIYISEENPVAGPEASILMPQLYPGTSRPLSGYLLRATRATTHLAVTILILTLLGYKTKELVLPWLSSK